LGTVRLGEAEDAINKNKNATAEVRRLYNVQEVLLGSGMFGKVYLATSKENKEVKFAVKILHKNKMSAALMDQMHEELAVLYKLDHPYICQYVESFEDLKYIYIIMEFCPGDTLFRRLEDKGKFTEREAAQLAYKLIEGLNHIHASDVVHRDLKPENVMIDEKGDPKIIDFGLSKDTQNFTRLLRSFVGSKVYMAPEILEGLGHGHGVDLWSLGIIIFLMISADFPFSSRNLDEEIKSAPIFFPPGKWEGVS
jgi:serine/threonine protein kinase